MNIYQIPYSHRYIYSTNVHEIFLLLQPDFINYEQSTESTPKNSCSSSQLLLQQVEQTQLPLLMVTTSASASVIKKSEGETTEVANEDHEPDSTCDFIENEILNELKSSCEELDTIETTESLPASEQDDLIKPVLQFNLGDKANEIKLNSSSTVLCNSSISEEDSGFLSSEAIIAMRESDSGLLENVQFVDADDDLVVEEKLETKPVKHYSKFCKLSFLF